MKLTRLTLSGFKSFAAPVELEFDEGVTAVVGPNGCGKSNISDAVRWVLGEQRTRILRGLRMEDVIFHGSARRKPVSLAEVSLIFDNGDGVVLRIKHFAPGPGLAGREAKDESINHTLVSLGDRTAVFQGTAFNSDRPIPNLARPREITERADAATRE